MADKNNRWNHPHWHLVFVMPLLVFLITEDDVITRCFLASGLALAAARYGHELATWTRAKDASAPDTSS
ncbi:hypothetical protein ABTY98_12195 [Streptomyces sp. NPDC096040]|uniref:hypothetical protein n=1 Tax=Streptomyces sp. NPDC096040 TaxID=3155541 RepID=UPI003331B7D0